MFQPDLLQNVFLLFMSCKQWRSVSSTPSSESVLLGPKALVARPRIQLPTIHALFSPVKLQDRSEAYPFLCGFLPLALRLLTLPLSLRRPGLRTETFETGQRHTNEVDGIVRCSHELESFEPAKRLLCNAELPHLRMIVLVIAACQTKCI